MRSPANMQIIQIDITNACIHNCSNCTRFCGLHRKPFFMDFETFKKAVDSLAGYKGIVGIMGGEPTLHPDFEKFMDYYQAHVPEPRPRTFCRLPLPDFSDWVARAIYQRGRHRGIWSSLGSGYYRHFEQIQDIFPYQVLNDHCHVNQHQALLISRRELGIPDEKWFPMRDRCWIQNLWSASITPKGAFFCEIAASLDMLLDGPGGWPIEPGWWRRTPADFSDQLHWCELCSAALNVPSLPASAQTDMMSPEMLERLKKINGWKISTGRYAVFSAKDYDQDAPEHSYIPTWFLPEGSETKRVSETTSTLFPKQLDVMVRNAPGQSTVSEDDVRNLRFSDFLVCFMRPKAYNPSIVETLRKRILNPGFLYVIDNDIYVLCKRAAALRNVSSLDLDSLPDLWTKRKRSHLSRRELTHRTLRSRIEQLLAVTLHRGAFLLPNFLFKNSRQSYEGGYK